MLNKIVLRLCLIGLFAGLISGEAEAQNQAKANTVEQAILIYNNFPDSSFKIGLQTKPGPVPEGVIGLPAGILGAGLTRAEAGALIAAVGVYLTPDLRKRKVPPLDRSVRFDRLLRSYQSCAGALISASEKTRKVPGGAFAVGLMRRVRTTDVKYAVMPDPDCSRVAR